MRKRESGGREKKSSRFHLIERALWGGGARRRKQRAAAEDLHTVNNSCNQQRGRRDADDVKTEQVCGDAAQGVGGEAET